MKHGSSMVTQFPDGAAVSVTMTAQEDYFQLLATDFRRIDDTYRQLQDRYHSLCTERSELENDGVCNGVRFTRSLAKGVAIYANHGTAAHCPMHGSHETGGRLRVYVGTYGDDQKVTPVLEAMGRWARYEFVFREQKRVRAALNDIFNDVKGLARRYGDSLVAGR